MQKIMLAVMVTIAIAGCRVYKIDIPQGTPLTYAQASQIKVGMTHQQVRFLLGTPTISDPLNAQRWDYMYNFIPGTYSRNNDLEAVKGQHLRVYFDETGIVTRVEGLETIPKSQPGLPGSREAILTAPPL